MKPRTQLKQWVSLQHQGQLIRGTNKPYVEHLFAVAEMARSVVTLGYEIGLCHDLLEDTDVTQSELLAALLGFGYGHEEAYAITSCVVELTDVYTSGDYPELSKSARKLLENKRLLTISPAAQTVKYADLIYNTIWMLKYDPKHAAQYMAKKRVLLADLNRGNAKLRRQLSNLISDDTIKSDHDG